MSNPLIFSSPRRRKTPLSGAFFTPANLNDLELIRTVETIAGDLISWCGNPDVFQSFFQRRNIRSLIRKVEILLSFLRSLGCSDDYVLHLPSSATTCLKELYIVIHRARILLDFCSQSSRIWLLLQNPQISGHFHDLNIEIATILDVFPLREIDLPGDVREQVELLHRHCRGSKLFVEPRDEADRLRIFSFLEEFEKGQAPDQIELRSAFFNRFGLRDAKDFHAEIEYLEDQICSQDEDADPSLLGGVIALVRYCRFRLLGSLKEEEGEMKKSHNTSSFLMNNRESSNSSIVKDFCCPISLDLMKDPVITSSGQTYDRASITQWIEEGHFTCPKSGQMLSHTRLMPNRALRNLIAQWCTEQGIPYNPLQSEHETSSSNGTTMYSSSSSAATTANKKTAEILLQKLEIGSESEKTIAAREIRLLAKTGKENRSSIAELGAIPLLLNLLSSPNSNTQENSITAILNLSILESNKNKIMELEGCLKSIVNVLITGSTPESRENAAATLFSLSAIHAYKKKITLEPGAVEALAWLLNEGTPRGKKDAVTALFNLSTHPECSGRMLESGAVTALIGGLMNETVAEEAAGALALVVRQQEVLEVVGEDEGAVGSLVGLMRRGSAKGKENAVAALHEICRSGGVGLTRRVARTPALGGLIQNILFTGTKRARRKAASLVRLCQKTEPVEVVEGGWELMEFGGRGRSSGFGEGDVVVAVTVGMSVPVL